MQQRENSLQKVDATPLRVSGRAVEEAPQTEVFFHNRSYLFLGTFSSFVPPPPRRRLRLAVARNPGNLSKERVQRILGGSANLFTMILLWTDSSFRPVCMFHSVRF